MPTVETGMEIGGFVLGRPLGEGGMGVVYEAQAHDDPPVALKILPVEAAEDPEYRARFEREIVAMQKLNHPNIVPLYSFGEENGLMYFAMRAIRGYTLTQISAHRRFSPREIAFILNPIADALEYAHHQEVIHRDIKPSNILIEAQSVGNVATYHTFLADFGLSKVVGTRTVTKPGVTLGTPQYMSPEQVLDEKISPLTDIYSLGIVLYELLVGRLPFASGSSTDIAIQHVEDPPVPLTKLSPRFPKALDDVVLCALAKNPEERFLTAGMMASAYAAALESIGQLEANTVYSTEFA
jgi:eukaryotic-like serine/threonine-protein kinase